MNNLKKTCRIIVFLFVLILVTGSAYTQTYEMRTVNKGAGEIGVEVRVNSGTPPTTSDYITDLSFGIKWASSYNVDLLPTFTTNYNIKKSGGRTLKGTNYFQSFYADNIPFALPADFVLNNWVEVLSIKNDMLGAGVGTFEIAQSGFDPSTDPNIGISLFDFTPVINGTATGVLLPITLETFAVTAANRAITLQWSAQNEQTAQGFEIQRSEVGTDQFKKVGWIDSKGSSNTRNQYTFIDKNVASNTRYYYRLKQVDLDGTFRYSELRTAILENLADHLISISPNPANNIIDVYFNDVTVKGKTVLHILDAKGVVVASGTENIEMGKKVRMNLSNLSSGKYFVVISTDDGLKISKTFIKN